MFSSRKEGFRYEFGIPMDCNFEVISIDERKMESSWGTAKLLNISPHGLKISSHLDLPVAMKKIGVKISFTIVDEELTVNGQLVWQKKVGKTFTYGVKLDQNEQKERKIIEELKRYTKLQRQK